MSYDAASQNPTPAPGARGKTHESGHAAAPIAHTSIAPLARSVSDHATMSKTIVRMALLALLACAMGASVASAADDVAALGPRVEDAFASHQHSPAFLGFMSKHGKEYCEGKGKACEVSVLREKIFNLNQEFVNTHNSNPGARPPADSPRRAGGRSTKISTPPRSPPRVPFARAIAPPSAPSPTRARSPTPPPPSRPSPRQIARSTWRWVASPI